MVTDREENEPVDRRRHPIKARLDEILRRLTTLTQMQGWIMSKLDDLEAELITANVTTTDIAAEMDDLIAKQNTPGLTAAEADQVQTDLQALGARLRAVAAKHPPTP